MTRVAIELGRLPDDPAFDAEWDALEAASIDGNAFMSRHFVRPALQHLTPGVRVLALRARIGGRLVGLGLFEPVAASPRLPLPHLRAYRCEHTYLTGFLVDAEHARPVALEIFRWLRRWRRSTAGG